MLATVDMGAEPDAVITDLPQRSHAESLKPAAIGEYRSVPAHELVQAAQIDHGLHARPEVQMIGVAQHYLGANVPHLFRGQCFDRGLSGNRHEERRERFAVRSLKLAGPSGSVRVV